VKQAWAHLFSDQFEAIGKSKNKQSASHLELADESTLVVCVSIIALSTPATNGTGHRRRLSKLLIMKSVINF